MKSASSFAVLVSIFFFWGFVAASNDILIPVFKEQLNLKQWQSQMISFAFYVAYTVGSILYILLSKLFKGDLLNRLGYKNGVALGLLISAMGTLLFIPAASQASFSIMICGLFTVGLGFSLQQTAANPLAINLGEKSKGSQRLSLAGAVNNIGTTIGPLLISYAIFGSILGEGKSLNSLDAIKTPYLILGAAFLIAAIFFKFSSLPNVINDDNKADLGIVKNKSVLSFPQLSLGMIAIFLYVGVEVSTASNLPEYLKTNLQISTNEIAPFVSLFWASLMIGRWTGAVSAFTPGKSLTSILRFIMPYLAFGLFLFVNSLANYKVDQFYVYGIIILVLIFCDIISKGFPTRQLFLFSLMGILALFIGIFSGGIVGAYAFMSVGLFCSTLWPCIFTIAIAGLGNKTNQGSSYLIMMIMGGGFVSLFQGFLADESLLGIKWSYLVGVICFCYLAFYGYYSNILLKKQGIDLEATK
ncbi:MAG: MFS transporter [Bacteroidia bacterium]